MMKPSNRQKGLTLIEIIVSIAILGIITLVFLSVFTSGFIGISSAGIKSRGEYKAQQVIEKEIASPTGTNYTVEDIDVQFTSTSDLTVAFSGIPDVTVSGAEVDATYDDGKRKASLKIFLPE